MSFIFYIPAKQTVTKGWLFKQLLDEKQHAQYSAAVIDETVLDQGEKLHRPGFSTRGVSVTREEKGYEITLNVLASKADWELAVQTARAIAEATDERVQPEHHGELTLNQFNVLCTDAWMEEQLPQGIAAVRTFIAEGNGPISLFGYRGSYAIGPKLIDRLGLAAADDRAMYDGLVQHFLDHQNALADYLVPAQYLLDGPVGGKQESALFWNPEHATYLHFVHWLFVDSGTSANGNKHILKVNYAQALQLISADPKLRLADETNFFAASFSPEEITALVAQLRPIAVDVVSSSTNAETETNRDAATAKPWWKIW